MKSITAAFPGPVTSTLTSGVSHPHRQTTVTHSEPFALIHSGPFALT